MPWTGLLTPCSKCGVTHERTKEHFPRKGEKVCRSCLNALKRAWALANPGRRSEHLARASKKSIAEGRDYYSRHREDISKRRQIARQTRTSEQREADRQRLAAYYQTHKEQCLGRSKEYRLKNADRVKQRSRSWLLSNRDRFNANSRAWRKRNQEKARAWVQNCKEARRGADGTFTGEEPQSRYDEQCGLCAYCLVPLNGEYHVEHVIPLSRGGTNWIDNIVCACATCNLSKGNKTILEFLQHRERDAQFSKA